MLSIAVNSQSTGESSAFSKKSAQSLQNSHQLRQMLASKAGIKAQRPVHVTLADVPRSIEKLPDILGKTVSANSDGKPTSEAPEPASGEIKRLRIRRCNAITFTQLQNHDASGTSDDGSHRSSAPSPPQPAVLDSSKLVRLDNVSTDLAEFLLDQERKRSFPPSSNPSEQ